MPDEDAHCIENLLKPFPVFSVFHLCSTFHGNASDLYNVIDPVKVCLFSFASSFLLHS